MERDADLASFFVDELKAFVFRVAVLHVFERDDDDVVLDAIEVTDRKLSVAELFVPFDSIQ
jgi:hypothetical protein